MPRPTVPDVLVLGVGGILGEAWMSSFLAGFSAQAGIDFRHAGGFVGTSAGAIVAAGLAGGVRADDVPASAGAATDQRAASANATPGPAPGRVIPSLAPAALSIAAPAGALVRAAVLARLPDGRMSLDGLRRRVASFRASFDGRLRVVVVDRRSGRRVVFGSPGAPDAEVAEAVVASCAVPGVFRPVRIAERDYVDGGVWSPTNLDVAPVGRGTRVLCLVPTAALHAAPAAIVRTLGRGWKVATALEAAVARASGAQVTIVEPDADSAAAMGGDLMNARRRSQVLAAGFAQGKAAAGASARGR